jgi:hypothetical protein
LYEFLPSLPVILNPVNSDKFHNQDGLSLHMVVMILICGTVLVISGILLLGRRYYPKWRHQNSDYGNKKYGTKAASDEFSEVRYLTGDDELDFTMATEKE